MSVSVFSALSGVGGREIGRLTVRKGEGSRDARGRCCFFFFFAMLSLCRPTHQPRRPPHSLPTRAMGFQGREHALRTWRGRRPCPDRAGAGAATKHKKRVDAFVARVACACTCAAGAVTPRHTLSPRPPGPVPGRAKTRQGWPLVGVEAGLGGRAAEHGRLASRGLVGRGSPGRPPRGGSISSPHPALARWLAPHASRFRRRARGRWGGYPPHAPP